MPSTFSGTTRRSRLQHSRRALAHSVSPSAWRATLEFRRADPTFAIGFRVGLAGAIALVVGGLVGHTEVAGFAALGTLSSAYLRYEPYPRMAGRLAGVASLIVAYTTLGALLGVLGVSIWAQILLVSGGAGLAFWLCAAFRITGPGPAIMIFAAAGAAGFAHTAADAVTATFAAAFGGLVGWVVAMAPALSHPHGPSRVAVARALAAVSGIEHYGPGSVAAARASIGQAREVIARTPARRVDAHVAELISFLDAAESVLDSGSHDSLTARREDFSHLEAELRKVRPNLTPPRERTDVTMPGTAPKNTLRESLRGLSDREIGVNVARVTTASLLAGGLATAAGLTHPLWASIGALAALQGVNYRHTVQRAIQRLVGNVGGAVLAAIIIAAGLGYWPLVVVIVVCQGAAEMVVTRNYALASVPITAMALLVTSIGNPVGADIGATRVFDTLLGVMIGVVVAAVTIRLDDRHHLDTT
ncbi:MULTISPECIES: FUSC family protein [Gordonia]|uniref:FUSC family protein n=1 Tax=Gordonia TaxID=2053 RepID=UPI0013313C69|nr:MULTISPECIES: FUSC family protein [Gordonia]KAF0968039.1 hypothetical protein BPODLACK_03498 [Gordonia sp. YY1]UPW16054.1 FUSC family protein [Gordonia amicalis]